MTGPLYAVGRFCSRHHYPVIAVWVIAAIVLVLLGQASGDKTNDNLTLPGTGSTKATNLLEDKLPGQAYGSNPLVIESHGAKLTSAAYSKAVSATVKNLNDDPIVTSAISPLSSAGVGFPLEERPHRLHPGDAQRRPG